MKAHVLAAGIPNSVYLLAGTQEILQPQPVASADNGPASIDDPASLDRALTGAAAVINCAGPFASTATAARRLLDSRTQTAGVITVGEISNSADFLRSLSP